MINCYVCMERMGTVKEATDIRQTEIGVVYLCRRHAMVLDQNVKLAFEVLVRKTEYSDHELKELGATMRGYRQKHHGCLSDPPQPNVPMEETMTGVFVAPKTKEGGIMQRWTIGFNCNLPCMLEDGKGEYVEFVVVEAEIERLKAINAELLEALEEWVEEYLSVICWESRPEGEEEWPALKEVKALIAKAKEE